MNEMDAPLWRNGQIPSSNRADVPGSDLPQPPHTPEAPVIEAQEKNKNCGRNRRTR